jgi:hypothetical protein
VAGAGWQAEGVTVTLGLGAGGPALEVAVAGLSLPPPLGRVEGLRLRCPQVLVDAAGYRCPAGRGEMGGSLLDRPDFGLDLVFDPTGRLLEAGLSDLALAGGRGGATLRRGPEGWEAGGEATGLDLARVAGALAAGGWLPAGWEAGGTLGARVSAAGGEGAERVSADLSLANGRFTDAAGLHAGEGLKATARLQGRRTGPGTAADDRPGPDRDRGQAGGPDGGGTLPSAGPAGPAPKAAPFDLEGSLRVERGELYLDPVYLQAAGGPVELTAAGTWVPGEAGVDLARLGYRHRGVVSLEASGRARLGEGAGVDRARLRVTDARIGPLYEGYLQPWLAATVLGRLSASGRARGEVTWGATGVDQVRLTLEEAAVEDRDGRFGLRGVAGTVGWAARGAGAPTSLRWAGGNLLRIPIGPATLEATARGQGLRLERPLELPVLDGTALVDRLEVTGIGSPGLAGSLEGLLTPISMEALTAALGWPPMGGSLSGVIPRVRYAAGRAEVEGALLVRVFGGEVVVRGLVLERLLGLVPTLRAEVDLRDLDLEPLTRTFAFGAIEGRLGGAVRGLTLEGWQPTAFEARLETPAGDRSRHRISQRAVESLASLGGAGAALSRTFLGMFESFGYDRLGIACRLRDGVCEMDGVAPADGGYSIVRGAGLPRIDVVGYNRRVDWVTLLDRLRSATRAGPPVVE